MGVPVSEGCTPFVPAFFPAGALTLDLVEVAGLLLGEEVGMCIFAWIHLVHKEGAEPAALGIPGVAPAGQQGRNTPGMTGWMANRDPEASLPVLRAAASIVRLPESPRASSASAQFILGALSQTWGGLSPVPVCPPESRGVLAMLLAQQSKHTGVGVWDKGGRPHESPLSPNGHRSDSNPSMGGERGHGATGASPTGPPLPRGCSSAGDPSTGKGA